VYLPPVAGQAHCGLHSTRSVCRPVGEPLQNKELPALSQAPQGQGVADWPRRLKPLGSVKLLLWLFSEASTASQEGWLPCLSLRATGLL
jgi:hypothetical protein